MSLKINKPLATIVLGINPEQFDFKKPKEDHFLFLIKDILVRDFKNYTINCYLDTHQKSKYLLDIHNAQQNFEVADFRDVEYPLSKIYFPNLESRIYETLEDFEIRFPKKMYENFLPKLGILLSDAEVSLLVKNSIEYCLTLKSMQKKVELFNKIITDHKYDFSGFSFYLNYAEDQEIYLVDFRNNILGVFDPQINISLIELWINTIGEIKTKAKKLGYNYITSQEKINKNAFGSFITPNISDDLFTNTEQYKEILDHTDEVLTSNNSFNEIKNITRSTFLFFKESFKDGMAEKCYDLTYNQE